MADHFMSVPLSSTMHECIRATGTADRIRIDAETRHFGVAFNVVVIRTFHSKSAATIANKGGPQQLVLSECAKVR